jgi:hypothetical protein
MNSVAEEDKTTTSVAGKKDDERDELRSIRASAAAAHRLSTMERPPTDRDNESDGLPEAWWKPAGLNGTPPPSNYPSPRDADVAPPQVPKKGKARISAVGGY